jgi:hypothetical protein
VLPQPLPSIYFRLLVHKSFNDMPNMTAMATETRVKGLPVVLYHMLLQSHECLHFAPKADNFPYATTRDINPFLSTDPACPTLEVDCNISHGTATQVSSASH